MKELVQDIIVGLVVGYAIWIAYEWGRETGRDDTTYHKGYMDGIRSHHNVHVMIDEMRGITND